MRKLGLAMGVALMAGTAMAQQIPAAYQGTWTLSDINRAPFYGGATLVMTGPGSFAGQGPCNQYSGTAAGTLPAFEVGQLMSTRMSCQMLETEHEYFGILKNVVTAEVRAGGLYLSTVNGITLHYLPGG